MSDSKSSTKRPLYGAAALGAGPGRPKGMQNKVTTEFKETVRRLLEDNSDNVGRWLKAVAEGNIEDGGKREGDPGKALDLMAKLAEYAAPKLGRVEHVGDAGGPIQQSHTITVEEFRKVAEEVARKV